MPRREGASALVRAATATALLATVACGVMPQVDDAFARRRVQSGSSEESLPELARLAAADDAERGRWLRRLESEHEALPTRRTALRLALWFSDPGNPAPQLERARGMLRSLAADATLPPDVAGLVQLRLRELQLRDALADSTARARRAQRIAEGQVEALTAIERRLEGTP